MNANQVPHNPQYPQNGELTPSLRDRALAASLEQTTIREARDGEREVDLVGKAIADHRRRFGECGELTFHAVKLGTPPENPRVVLQVDGLRFMYAAMSLGGVAWYLVDRCSDGCGRWSLSTAFEDLAGLGAVLTRPEFRNGSCCTPSTPPATSP